MEKLEENFDEATDLYIYYLKTDYTEKHKKKIRSAREITYKMGEWVYLKEKEPVKRSYVHTLYLATGLSQPAFLGDSVAKLAEKQKTAPEQFRTSVEMLIYYNLSSSSSTAKVGSNDFGKSPKFDVYETAVIDLIDIERKLEIGEDLYDDSAKKKVDQKLFAISKSVQKIRDLGIRWNVNHTIIYLWKRIHKNVDWRKLPLF